MNETQSQSDSTARETSAHPVLSTRRKWLFRAMALILSLIPLLFVEGALRLCGWPEVKERDDPLIGFQNPQPLFRRSADNEFYEIAPERREFFRPDRFRVDKGNNEFRVFCLGGSTVQGRPYQIETSFTTWLELTLKASDPTKDWRIVNCGGVSYASYRLIPILEEVLDHQPDLVVICSGHNEFLEDRTYARLRDVPQWQRTAHRTASNLKLYQAMRLLWMRMIGNADSNPKTELLAGEVQARLDFEGGLELFVRDDIWREHVATHYEYNLRRMIRLTKERGVPVVVMNPVENLRDCGPFKSLTSDPSDTELTQKITALLDDAQQLPVSAIDERMELIQKALKLDDRFAKTHYLLGQTYDTAGDRSKARHHFQRAIDEDICPLRMLGSMHDALEAIAGQEGIPWIDLNKHFAARSNMNITDSEWLLDHVHPSIEGHKVIASLLHDEMTELGILAPTKGWEADRDLAYEEHTKSLGFAYYEHGRQRLEGLQFWTQGRAHGALPESSKIPVVVE